MRKRHFYAIGFFILMVFDTLTQVSVKLASSSAGTFSADPAWLLAVVHNPWVFGAVAGYLGAFVAWMTLLKQAPVGPAFAASHLGVVPVLAISAAYFGERLSIMQIVGTLCILVGIAFLSLSEARHTHD